MGRAQEGNAGPHPKFSLGQICGKFAEVFDGKTPKFVVVHRKTDFFVSLATRDVPWRFVDRVSFASRQRSLSCVVAQLHTSHRKDYLELAMTVRKEQYEDGGASGKRAIIPLR